MKPRFPIESPGPEYPITSPMRETSTIPLHPCSGRKHKRAYVKLIRFGDRTGPLALRVDRHDPNQDRRLTYLQGRIIVKYFCGNTRILFGTFVPIVSSARSPTL